MKKSRYVMVIEEEEVRGDDPIEYFPPRESKYLLGSRGGNGN